MERQAVYQPPQPVGRMRVSGPLTKESEDRDHDDSTRFPSFCSRRREGRRGRGNKERGEAESRDLALPCWAATLLSNPLTTPLIPLPSSSRNTTGSYPRLKRAAAVRQVVQERGAGGSRERPIMRAARLRCGLRFLLLLGGCLLHAHESAPLPQVSTPVAFLSPSPPSSSSSPFSTRHTMRHGMTVGFGWVGGWWSRQTNRQAD